MGRRWCGGFASTSAGMVRWLSRRMWASRHSSLYAAIVYDLVKRIGRLLSLPLTLHHSIAPGLQRIRERDPKSHKYDNVPPEVAVFAVCLIIMKMAYGMDGKERFVGNANSLLVGLTAHATAEGRGAKMIQLGALQISLRCWH
jgi:hypothetical protein